MSGRQVHLDVADDVPLSSLLHRAQAALHLTGKFSVLNASGVKLDVEMTIGQLGLQSGDVLTLHTRPVCLAATEAAFAALLGDGSVATWGSKGGDSSEVKQQLHNVQEIQASEGAFAAITDTGSV